MGNQHDALVFLADGFEEIEGLGAIDILRRGGMNVTSVSVNDTAEVTGAHGIKTVADKTVADVADVKPTWVVLPGGLPGADNLYKSEQVQAHLKDQIDRDAYIAAICASPAVVLAQSGLMTGKHMTCYPGFDAYCKDAFLEDRRAVVDGKFVTANGPSSVTNMCYEILKIEMGEHVAVKVMNDMLIYPKEEPYFF